MSKGDSSFYKEITDTFHLQLKCDIFQSVPKTFFNKLARTAF